MSEITIADVALKLAEAHRAEDPDTKGVYLAEASDEIRLVEVSGSVETAGEVLPYRFNAQPDEDIPYPSVVILVSVEEWDKLNSGELELPTDWGSPGKLKKIA